MKEITLTINGKEVKGKEGDTVLDVCRSSDIYVPTLCHLDGLSDIGACRMCVVEIGGERRETPACTYPARDNLVVRTTSEQLEKHRRIILELIFSERNHFCMFCAQSGDCELQDLAYRYQMDHVRFPYAFPTFPVDTLNDYLVLDHNRCILCGRCVRICDEVVGSHTLDFSKRGWMTMIAADLDQPLGESSCTSCGACVQACPTGAIFSKVSAYRGRTSECEAIESVCCLCGVGCEIKVLVRDNNLVRIDGADLSEPRGQLCKMGRFEPLSQTRPRIIIPLKRNSKGKLEECSLDEALDLAARGIEDLKRSHGAQSIAGIASSYCTSDDLGHFNRLVREAIGSDKVGTLDGDSCRVIAKGIDEFDKGKGLDIECSLEEISEADCIIVVGANPLESHPVVGSYILRALAQRDSKLVVIDPLRNAFAYRAHLWLRPSEGSEGTLINGLASLILEKGLGDRKRVKDEFIQSLRDYKADMVCDTCGVEAEALELAAETYGKAERGVILYGDGVIGKEDPRLIASLVNLVALAGNTTANGLRIVSLKAYGNSRGAWELGLAGKNGFSARDIGPVKGVFLFLADDATVDESLIAQLKQVEFLVVAASYHSPFTSMAHVVLPSLIWAEREGEYVTLDGRHVRSKRALEPPHGVKEDGEIIAEIAKRLGGS